MSSLTFENGFINVQFSDKYWASKADDIVKTKALQSTISSKPKRRLIIDYSSPNIAKRMHVGHLRSTIIGDAIANIYEYLGWEVIRINHIGDFGTQFGMILALIFEENIEQKILSGKVNLDDLEKMYKQSKIKFDENLDFRDKAYEFTRRLQTDLFKQGNNRDNDKNSSQIVKIWTKICEISKENYSEIYKDLKIHKNLIDRGESFYCTEMVEMTTLDDKPNPNFTFENNMLLYKIKSKKFKNAPPLILKKSDGGFTYDTSDLACLKYRIKVEKADKIIYVTDIGQSVHFENLFMAGEELGIVDSLHSTNNKKTHAHVILEHIKFGLVLDENKQKFKTRSGDNIKLKDLIQDSFEVVAAQLKSSQVAKFKDEEHFNTNTRNLAISCIKFSDLISKREKSYVYNFERMVAYQGRTGAYVLYSYLRLVRILDKIEMKETNKRLDHIAQTLSIEERNLLKQISQFYDKLDNFENNHNLTSIADWLYNLAVIFTEFYSRHKVIENGVVNQDRQFICVATKVAMEQGFQLLGLHAVDEM